MLSCFLMGKAYQSGYIYSFVFLVISRFSLPPSFTQRLFLNSQRLCPITAFGAGGGVIRSMGFMYPIWHLLNSPSFHLVPEHYLSLPASAEMFGLPAGLWSSASGFCCGVLVFQGHSGLFAFAAYITGSWSQGAKVFSSLGPTQRLRPYGGLFEDNAVQLFTSLKGRGASALGKTCPSLSCTWGRYCFVCYSLPFSHYGLCLGVGSVQPSFPGTLTIGHLSWAIYHWPKILCSISLSSPRISFFIYDSLEYCHLTINY